MAYEPETQHTPTPSERPTNPLPLATPKHAPGAHTAPSVPGALGQDASEEDLEAQLAYQNLKRRREQRKRRRIVLAVLASIAVLAAGVVFVIRRTNDANEGGEDVPMLITGTVYREDFATTIEANGATLPLSSTVVTPEVDGIIEDLRVEEGSQVAEGDILCILKNERLDKTVREAEVAVEKAQREADSANRAVDDAYAEYNRAWNACNAEDDWSEFDESSLRAAIETAESAYQDSLSSLESAREELREAQETADKRTLRAPAAGSIVVMNARNGAAAGSAEGGSSENLMEIADLSQMQVTVQVNEVDIASIHEGQEAVVTFQALPGLTLSGQVRRIATEASGGDESGYGGIVTYAVNLLIPEPDPRLKPGMTASVSITTQSAPNSLVVPATALVEDASAFDGEAEDGSGSESGSEASYHVVVVDDEQSGATHDVPVKVLAQNSSEAAVEGELAEDDQVLLSTMDDFGGSQDYEFDTATAEMG